MATGREIRTKIGSVKSTQKITRAMEMVSASKIRKAQDRMLKSRPYALNIRRVIGHLAAGNPEYHHLYFDVREPKRVGYIVVSTDRGLCGGLNANLFRMLQGRIKEHKQQGVECEFCAIGTKGQAFIKRLGENLVAAAEHLGDEPQPDDVIGIVKVMLDAYVEKKIDALYIVTNDFVNTMSLKPMAQQLLPLEQCSDEEGLAKHWDYIYEPDARDVLDLLLARYIESQVYQAVVENLACEHAARMVAMKAATDNAGNLMDELELAYNKARQAAITQELSEIVSGAAAV